ncbi:MAG: hypothetical protein KC416_04495 [Myxococcales bacterium]|nr:hypothetical protein [Myxococcales bacterium]
MSSHATLLVAWTLLGAAWIVVQGALCVRIWSHRGPGWGWGFVPPWTPVAGYRAGARRWAILWFVCGALYIGLRLWPRVTP